MFSLRACLYINRHESCSVSVSWKVCAAAMTTDEEFSPRMRLRFGLQQCLPSNFSRHPLYTCTLSKSVLANVVPSHLQLAVAISQARVSDISPSLQKGLENICRHLSITGVMELEFREDYSHVDFSTRRACA